MEDIDFSAFSRDDFNPVEWINSIFPEHNDGAAASRSKETVATNLVYKLQLMVEETNNSLEEIAQRMSLSIPKVLGEADVLQGEASELCAQIVDVRTKLICAEQQHSSAVEILVEMDQAKRRLQDTYKALQEANNWTTLSMDVEEVFESGEFDQISAKIASMQQSLEMLSLSSSGDNADKLQTLERLKDRFEKIAEPVLVDAFLSHSSEKIEFYSKIFKELHRSDRLITYYQSCLRNQLLKEWSTQVKLDSEEKLLNWLNFLYDRLISMWRIQMNFCMKVLYPEDFSMSLKILCDICINIVQSLDPTIESCFHQLLNRLTETNDTKSRLIKQKSLIELKQFTNSFVKSIEQNLIEQYSGETSSLNEMINNDTSLNKFMRTIYQPFNQFNELFLHYERERLSEEFVDMSTECENLVSSECIIKLFTLARDSFKLYSQYVETYPILIVEDVIEEFLSKYLSLIKNKVADVHKEEPRALASSRNSSKSSLRPSNSSQSIATLLSPNWSHIQQTLFTFQIMGDFANQLLNLQQQIHLSLNDCRAKHETSRVTSEASLCHLARHDLFLLHLDSRHELQSLVDKYLQSPASLLLPVLNECIELTKNSAQSICDAIFEYIKVYLNAFASSIQQQISTQSDYVQSRFGEDEDESLSFSPNEYITQIGQYLLTLPQHLEPFNLSENNCFKTALKHSADVFHTTFTDEMAPTEILLDSLLQRTTRVFLDNILKLSVELNHSGSTTTVSSRKLSPGVRKQVGIDLSYLGAVCEDLGLSTDKEFLLYTRVFNEVQSKEAFQKLLQDNPNYHQMLRQLEEIIPLVN